MRRGQRGFTLIELMIVVAVLGVLAALAVYMFGKQQKRVTATSEVTAMFAEMKIKQDAYRLEFGSYLSTSATNSEGDTWPTAPSGDGGTISLSPYPANWTTLRLAPNSEAVRCAYVMVTGAGGDNSTVGPIADGTFSYEPSATDWYYVLAECDMDQNSATNSFYFQDSESTEMLWVDQGK